MDAIQFIQAANFNTCIFWIQIAKLLLKNHDEHFFHRLKRKRKSGGHDLNATHLDDSTLFVNNIEEASLLALVSEICFCSLSISSAFLDPHFVKLSTSCTAM